MKSLFLIVIYSRILTVILSSKSYVDDILKTNGFIWGVATAAYQIEGATNVDGKGSNIWDEFVKLPGKIKNNDTGDIADDSYHNFILDIEILKQMNVKSYRMSISWSRILPNGNGKVNVKGISYYNNIFNALAAANIDVVVTLYHWDLPSSLHYEYGGWLDEQIITDFLYYSDICFNSFGDRVKIWATLNEPWTFTFMGYGAGAFAPGRCSDRSKCAHGDSSIEPYIAAHNALNAHAAVVNLYRQKYQSIQKGIIGIVLNLDWAEPLTKSDINKAAANRKNEFQFGWFANPIFYGTYPQVMIDNVGSRLPNFTNTQKQLLIGSVDFLGVNHYSTKYFSEYPPYSTTIPYSNKKGWTEDQKNYESKYNLYGDLIGTQAESPWLNVVPWGFYNVIMWVTKTYTVNNVKPVIVITENGVDVPNESILPFPLVLNDTFRISYYTQYINELGHAIYDGADVRGYFVWSLLDNFEWADGYTCRFGLNYVNYNDPARTRYPKHSAIWYKDFISKHNNFKKLIFDNPTITFKEIRNIQIDSVSIWSDLLTGAVDNYLNQNVVNRQFIP